MAKEKKSKGRLDKYKKKRLKKTLKSQKKNVRKYGKKIYFDRNGNKVNKKYKINLEQLLKFIIAMSIILGIGSSIFNIAKLQLQQIELMEKQKALMLEKEALKKELANSSDPEYIEEQARIQLQLIKPGEKLFILTDDEEVEVQEEINEEENKIFNIFNKDKN